MPPVADEEAVERGGVGEGGSLRVAALSPCSWSEVKASRLKETILAPELCAPRPPLIDGCSRATALDSPVTRQTCGSAAAALATRPGRARAAGRSCRKRPPSARIRGRRRRSGHAAPRAKAAAGNPPAASRRGSAGRQRGPGPLRRRAIRHLLAEGGVLLRGALALADGDAELVGRFVPEEVRVDGDRALLALRNQQRPRLWPLTLAAQVDHMGDRAVLVQRDQESDPLGGVAERRRGGQPLVGADERSQHARRPISEEVGCGTAIKPSSSRARKNSEGRPGAA
jgi:hypothetical protein